LPGESDIVPQVILVVPRARDSYRPMASQHFAASPTESAGKATTNSLRTDGSAARRQPPPIICSEPGLAGGAAYQP